jgi:hypothetical protein
MPTHITFVGKGISDVERRNRSASKGIPFFIPMAVTARIPKY